MILEIGQRVQIINGQGQGVCGVVVEQTIGRGYSVRALGRRLTMTASSLRARGAIFSVSRLDVVTF